MMSTPLAVILAGILIAASILVAGRYQITHVQFQGFVPATLRLDRWTGAIDGCVLDADSTSPDSIVGAAMTCRAKNFRD